LRASLFFEPCRGFSPFPVRGICKKSLNVSSDFFFEYGGEVGLDSQAHPTGGTSAVQNVSALRAILSNPVEASHPSQCGEYAKKSLNVSSDFFFEYGGEVGLDSQAHPTGGTSAVQNVSALRAILSNPVEASHPSQCGEYAKKKSEREFRLLLRIWR
jgi:hypothetical protein